MNISIGILLISTWKYNKFIDPVINDIRKFFFPNNNKNIYLHTDSCKNHNADTIIKIEHKPWPLITLNRFKIFYENRDKYNVDYLFYLDVDCKIVNYVLEDILSDFVVVEHHWFVHKRGTPETNKKSLACIFDHEPLKYVAGAFFGGSKDRFIDVSKLLSNNIDKDLSNNIIAKFHDESHLNRYVVDHKNSIKFLSSAYMYSPSNTRYKMKNPKIIPYSNSEKGFNKYENMVHR